MKKIIIDADFVIRLILLTSVITGLFVSTYNYTNYLNVALSPKIAFPCDIFTCETAPEILGMLLLSSFIQGFIIAFISGLIAFVLLVIYYSDKITRWKYGKR